MNKNSLEEILNNPLSHFNLYNLVNIDQTDESRFNEQDYDRFVLRAVWWYMIIDESQDWEASCKEKGIDGFDDFCDRLIKNKDKVCTTFKDDLQAGTGWTNVPSLSKSNEYAGKIFLSVTNDQLYFLADELLKKIIKVGMKDCDFKVNADENISRRDGIVIYFTEHNFRDYIKIIKSVQKAHPEIRFKEPNCFAYRYDDVIGIGKDYEGGEKSFTQKCCEVVDEIRRRGKPGFPFEPLERAIDEQLKDLITLCEKTRESEIDR